MEARTKYWYYIVDRNMFLHSRHVIRPSSRSYDLPISMLFIFAFRIPTSLVGCLSFVRSPDSISLIFLYLARSMFPNTAIVALRVVAVGLLWAGSPLSRVDSPNLVVSAYSSSSSARSHRPPGALGSSFGSPLSRRWPLLPLLRNELGGAADLIVSTRSTASIGCGDRSRSPLGMSSRIAPLRAVPPGIGADLDLLSPHDLTLASCVLAFSASHIGMSAVRNRLIGGCGRLASSFGLVGTDLSLPDFWPGDESGNTIFPDEDAAGRQVYRAGYALISFGTLGSALASYLASVAEGPRAVVMTADQHYLYFAVAAVSFGAAITSLFNASPLSLMPKFDGAVGGDSVVSAVRREDSLKLIPGGLTRITRHPLILPVVPWGIANSQLAGGRDSDALLFGGLAVYALLGCAAQDLRIIRGEGSVGTVFRRPSDNEGFSEYDDEEGGALRNFFGSTSFWPFAAVLDGRQSLSDAAKEIPWAAFVSGCVAGAYMEGALLNWLDGTTII